jgi:molybdenum cofactor guanylyltransferase
MANTLFQANLKDKIKFQGFVLAGGKSSRMKTDKAFLKIDGEIFLKRAVNILLPNCDEVKIVINEKQYAKYEKISKSFDFVFDIYADRGAIGGIHAALKNCKSDWATILAVDLPYVTSEAVAALSQTALESGEISAVVSKQSDGRIQPLCGVYRVKDCLPIAEKLLGESSSVPVREFLRFLSTRDVRFDQFENKDLLFFNVNRPSDYQQINYFKTRK